MSLFEKRVPMTNEKFERIKANACSSNRYLYTQIVFNATEYKLIQEEKK